MKLVALDPLLELAQPGRWIGAGGFADERIALVHASFELLELIGAARAHPPLHRFITSGNEPFLTLHDLADILIEQVWLQDAFAQQRANLRLGQGKALGFSYSAI